MRERKSALVITFSTTTQAMAMEHTCQEAAMPGRLIPLPRELSAGCGLCWKTGLMEPEHWVEYMLKEHLIYDQIKELLLP